MLKSGLIATIGLAAFSSVAVAADSCDTYGKLALQQQKQNESGKCGFSGPEWSSDLKAHIGWCGGVSPQEWQAMLQKRTRMLAECAGKG